MKTSNRFARRPRTTPARRAQLLARFDRSGLPAAVLARCHGLAYSTFCSWRQGQAKVERAPGFVQVELVCPTPPSGLVIELGPLARIRLTDASAIGLTARLLQALAVPTLC